MGDILQEKWNFKTYVEKFKKIQKNNVMPNFEF